MMRRLAAGVATVLCGLAGALSAELPDLERGRALYENHCVVCHTAGIHGRVNRIPINADELRDIVTTWQQEERLRWNAQDIEDVVEFLRQTRYKF
jgi:mono/diheme cytochrome c family protein